MNNSVGSQIFQILFFGLLGFFLLRIANKRHYFDELYQPIWRIPIEWFRVLAAFGIYFTFSFYIIPTIYGIFKEYLQLKVAQGGGVAVMTWINFGNGVLVLSSLLLYSKGKLKKLWLQEGKNPDYKGDLKTMVVSLALAFPIVFCSNAFFDLVVHQVFAIKNLPDQIAVQWLKMTFDYPFYLLLTTITVVILAPLLEELLFRGYLQSFLREHLGRKQAIIISSFCFSCFHFSKGQGWSNIPIIASLFPLALFLGYLYEKRGSLFAPISMHAAFNSISLVNIYFFGQFL